MNGVAVVTVVVYKCSLVDNIVSDENTWKSFVMVSMQQYSPVLYSSP